MRSSSRYPRDLKARRMSHQACSSQALYLMRLQSEAKMPNRLSQQQMECGRGWILFQRKMR